MNEPYGTTEYYKGHFLDILSDAACLDTVEENTPHVERILEGFQDAVIEWLSYHQHAADTYQVMLDKFLAGPDEDKLRAEEDALPPIPDIPSVFSK